MHDVNVNLEVRPARAEDKEPIVAFCQNTFSWGDYIGYVWDRWLDDPHGRLFVGAVNGKPVGVLHVVLIDEVAWMEGMRVDPEFRRLGIGKAVDAVARAWARESGAKMVQLATAMHNTTAQKTLDAEGYSRVAAFKEWTANAQVAAVPEPRMATEEDIPAILGWWNASPLRQAGHLLLPDQHWHWTALTAERLKEPIRDGQVRVLSNGFSLISTWDGDDEKEMNVHAIVGDAETTWTLALAARAEAARRDYPRLVARLADDPALDSIMEQAGYARDDGMLIYEQSL